MGLFSLHNSQRSILCSRSVLIPRLATALLNEVKPCADDKKRYEHNVWHIRMLLILNFLSEVVILRVHYVDNSI